MPDAMTTTTPPPTGMTRRTLLARAGLAGAAALGTGLIGNAAPAEASTAKRVAYGPTATQGRFVVGDLDILMLALNLEYLEAEFYLRAVNGEGLPETSPGSLVTGGQGFGPGPNKAAAPGLVTSYVSGTTNLTTGTTTAVPFTDATIKSFAAEMAQNASSHVALLRKTLGKRAPARPAIDIGPAFTAFMRTSTAIGPTDVFDPFASQRNFLLASFLLNDIGPTLYVEASQSINGTNNLKAAAGLLGAKSYHAGLIRTLVFSLSQEQSDDLLLTQAGAIVNLRNNLALLGGAPNPSDAGLLDADGHANITPADGNAIAYGRGFAAVLNVLYQGTTASTAPTPGGFLPSGANCRIR